MAKSLSAIRQIVRQILKDEYTSEDYDFADDELNIHINEALIELSQRSPYEVKESLTIANKSGKATSTSALHLVDATNAQFVAGDVGKTVYNATDETEATVSTFNSASDLTIDTDIMASGESYYLYNADCTSGKQVNISDITDLIEVEKAEYETRQDPQEFRNVSIFGDIATLDIPFTPTDGNEVFLYCHKVHTLTESSSTLKPALEKVLIEGVIAKAAQGWLNKMRDQIVPNTLKWYQDWANNQLLLYRNSLSSISKGRAWKYY